MTTLLLSLGALLVGVLLGYLVALTRSASRQRELELRTVRAEEGLAAVERGAQTQIAAARSAGELQAEELRRQTADRVAIVQRAADEKVAAAEERATERVAAAQADQARLAEQFQAVANKALAANNEQFLAIAKERFGREQQTGDAALKARQEAVQALVGPLAENLEKMREQVLEAERTRLTGTVDLKHQVVEMRTEAEKLRKETSQLKNALGKSQVRGTWGELQLRRLVEAAGMLDRVDFEEQVRASDGALRPDMVVRLAGGKSVVVDAKVSLAAFIEAQETDDDVVRADRMAAHARHMRKHVDDLHKKEYWEQFTPTPEFVIMFVPAESFLSAALDHDPSLLQYALERNVILASPMTLLALLRTVAYAWRQEALAENAQRVLDLGREFHSRLVTMTTHVTKLGRSLSGATESYNQFIGSLERNVLTSARRFADLEVVTDQTKALPEVRGIEESIRPITKAELLMADSGGVVAIDGKVVDGTSSADSGSRAAG